jgi:thiazole synthase ThiGH ThiG subunit
MPYKPAGQKLLPLLWARRLEGKKDPFANILDFIDPSKYLILPNTSGALNADEAVRLARLAAAAGLPKWIKLEIHPDPRYLLPDPIETYKAAEHLVKEDLLFCHISMRTQYLPNGYRKLAPQQLCRLVHQLVLTVDFDQWTR